MSRIDRGIGYMLNTADVSQASLFLASQTRGNDPHNHCTVCMHSSDLEMYNPFRRWYMLQLALVCSDKHLCNELGNLE